MFACLVKFIMARATNYVLQDFCTVGGGEREGGGREKELHGVKNKAYV